MMHFWREIVAAVSDVADEISPTCLSVGLLINSCLPSPWTHAEGSHSDYVMQMSVHNTSAEGSMGLY